MGDRNPGSFVRGGFGDAVRAAQAIQGAHTTHSSLKGDNVHGQADGYDGPDNDEGPKPANEVGKDDVPKPARDGIPMNTDKVPPYNSHNAF